MKCFLGTGHGGLSMVIGVLMSSTVKRVGNTVEYHECLPEFDIENIMLFKTFLDVRGPTLQ